MKDDKVGGFLHITDDFVNCD